MATRAATLVFPKKEYNRGGGYRSFSLSRLSSIIRSTCPCNKLVLGSQPGYAHLAWERKVILSLVSEDVEKSRLMLHLLQGILLLKSQSQNLLLSNHDSHKPRASREHPQTVPAFSLQPPAAALIGTPTAARKHHNLGSAGCRI
ncbi:hypothetical protein BDW75DRAFT_220624 [Aspergillus navahoensis]